MNNRNSTLNIPFFCFVLIMQTTVTLKQKESLAGENALARVRKPGVMGVVRV